MKPSFENPGMPEIPVDLLKQMNNTVQHVHTTEKFMRELAPELINKAGSSCLKFSGRVAPGDIQVSFDNQDVMFGFFMLSVAMARTGRELVQYLTQSNQDGKTLEQIVCMVDALCQIGRMIEHRDYHQTHKHGPENPIQLDSDPGLPGTGEPPVQLPQMPKKPKG